MNTPNTPAAINFLQKQSSQGPCILTAIHPETRKTDTCTFPNAASAAPWIDEKQGRWNIYFTVNPCKTALTSKAKKIDISHLAWLHVDIDPRVGEDFEREREIIRRKLEAFEPKPTVITDSGGWPSR